MLKYLILLLLLPQLSTALTCQSLLSQPDYELFKLSNRLTPPGQDFLEKHVSFKKWSDILWSEEKGLSIGLTKDGELYFVSTEKAYNKETQSPAEVARYEEYIAAGGFLNMEARKSTTNLLSGDVVVADYRISNDGKVIFKDFDENVYAIIKIQNEVFTKFIEVDLNFDSTNWFQNKSIQWKLLKNDNEFFMEQELEEENGLRVWSRIKNQLGFAKPLPKNIPLSHWKQTGYSIEFVERRADEMGLEAYVDSKERRRFRIKSDAPNSLFIRSLKRLVETYGVEFYNDIKFSTELDLDSSGKPKKKVYELERFLKLNNGEVQIYLDAATFLTTAFTMVMPKAAQSYLDHHSSLLNHDVFLETNGKWRVQRSSLGPLVDVFLRIERLGYSIETSNHIQFQFGLAFSDALINEKTKQIILNPEKKFKYSKILKSLEALEQQIKIKDLEKHDFQ